MTDVDLDIAPPKKPITEVLKPLTDRVTRERSEHPDRIPTESKTHPVTKARALTRGPVSRRERIGA